MPVEVDGVRQSSNGEPADASVSEDEPQDSLTELLEQLARELTALVFLESRLAASRHKPELLRAGRDVVSALGAGVALLIAFALANAAAVLALATAMPAWAAALVLALVWTAVGGLLVLSLLARARRATAWNLETAEQARHEAEQAVRDTLERLTPVITKEIALAAIPAAGDMASGVVDAGDDLLEAADDIVESIADDVPGGGAINQIWDVVLMPGRLGVRVATTVLKRGDSQGER